jgi:cytochrome c
MKVLTITVIVFIAAVLCISGAYAMKHQSAERGKALFEDDYFAGGEKACSACHPNGRGLGKAGSKKEFHIMGKTQKSLEEAVNFCIVGANKGNAIDEKSAEMKDIVSYIKSLSKKSPGY